MDLDVGNVGSFFGKRVSFLFISDNGMITDCQSGTLLISIDLSLNVIGDWTELLVYTLCSLYLRLNSLNNGLLYRFAFLVLSPCCPNCDA